MTDNIVNFPPRDEPTVFVCNCGCSSYEFLSNGDVICAMCETVAHELTGSWDHLDNAPMRPANAEPRIREISFNRDPEFARALVLKRANEEDAVGVIVVRESGFVHMWTSVEGDAQREWLVKQIKSIDDLLKVYRG